MHRGERRLLPGGHARGDRIGHKPIETVRAEDRVWAFDLVTGEWRLCRVVETYETDYIGEKIRIRVAGEWIDSTRHHPVWVVEGKNLEERPRPEHVRQAETADATIPGRWVDAGDVQPGDVLLLKPDRRAKVETRELQLIATKVYNFQVEGLHNYAVGLGSVLVHNNAPCPFGTPGFGTEVHQSFEDALLEQTGTKPGDWQMRTEPGQTGPDAEYVGDPGRDPGFTYAELKPATDSGWNRFQQQMRKWNLPPGKTQLWGYGASGAIGTTGENF